MYFHALVLPILVALAAAAPQTGVSCPKFCDCSKMDPNSEAYSQCITNPYCEEFCWGAGPVAPSELPSSELASATAWPSQSSASAVQATATPTFS